MRADLLLFAINRLRRDGPGKQPSHRCSEPCAGVVPKPAAQLTRRRASPLCVSRAAPRRQSWARRPTPGRATPPAALEVVELCGRLPLTIALAGAMLQEHADKWVTKLSGGTKRKLIAAIALACEPRVTLYFIIHNVYFIVYTLYNLYIAAIALACEPRVCFLPPLPPAAAATFYRHRSALPLYLLPPPLRYHPSTSRSAS